MKVRLGDYIQEYSVKNKDDENISVYSVTNTKGFCKDYFGKEVASKDKTTYKIVPYGYFAYNPSRINVGSVDWQRKEKKVIVSPLYNVFSVSPNLERQYLYYYLKSDFVLQRIKAVATGSVRDNLKLSMLYEFPIELPKLENQRKIVKILDKVSDVIEKKEQELEQLETLVKFRFVETFGNPLNGTAKYPIHQVGEVANLVDPQPSHRTPPVEENGVPYVSIKDCDYKTGKIDFEGARKVSPTVLEEHLNRYTLHEGDFVIGKIGTIGNPVFIPACDDYTLSANIVLVQPNRELVSPYFLKYSFESDFVERQFAEAKNSTSQAAFGIQKVRTVKVMNPDLDVQNKFENFVQQVDKLKYIDISDDEVEKCVVRKGDVLFNRTNSIDLVGKTAVFDLQDDMVIAGYIIRVRLNEKILPEVLSQYMNLEALKDILRSMAKGAVNQANINAQELQSIRVYVPDIELQKQFVEMKDQVDKSK